MIRETIGFTRTGRAGMRAIISLEKTSNTCIEMNDRSHSVPVRRHGSAKQYIQSAENHTQTLHSVLHRDTTLVERGKFEFALHSLCHTLGVCHWGRQYRVVLRF